MSERTQQLTARGLASIVFFMILSLIAHTAFASEPGVEDGDYEYDDDARSLATLTQSNGNVLEFLSNPELEELTLWETGPIDRAVPVFDDPELDRLTMLERYLLLAPLNAPVPADLVRFSELEPTEVERLIAGRRLVETIAAPIDIGDHFAADPAVAASACTGIFTGPWDWYAYRNSGCNVDGKAKYVKARICNKSNWGYIRMQLGYKNFCWSNNFNYPSSKTKDVSWGNYGVVAVSSVNRCRRARYIRWDAFWEQAIVGGWFDQGSVTTNNCS